MMIFRRQKIESRTSFFFEKKIIVEIFEIQSKTKITIFIKIVFEKKSLLNITSNTKIQYFVIIFQNIEMIDTFVKTLNDLIIDQLKPKFVTIDVEKRRIYLRHLLTQAKRIRNDFEQ